MFHKASPEWVCQQLTETPPASKVTRSTDLVALTSLSQAPLEVRSMLGIPKELYFVSLKCFLEGWSKALWSSCSYLIKSVCELVRKSTRKQDVVRHLKSIPHLFSCQRPTKAIRTCGPEKRPRGLVGHPRIQGVTFHLLQWMHKCWCFLIAYHTSLTWDWQKISADQDVGVRCISW